MRFSVKSAVAPELVKCGCTWEGGVRYHMICQVILKAARERCALQLERQIQAGYKWTDLRLEPESRTIVSTDSLQLKVIYTA